MADRWVEHPVSSFPIRAMLEDMEIEIDTARFAIVTIDTGGVVTVMVNRVFRDDKGMIVHDDGELITENVFAKINWEDGDDD